MPRCANIILLCLFFCRLTTQTTSAEGDRIALTWGRSGDKTNLIANSIRFCPSDGGNFIQSNPVELPSSGQLLLHFDVIPDSVAKPSLTVHYKTTPGDNQDPGFKCNSSSASTLFQEFEWLIQPEGLKEGDNFVVVSLPCPTNKFVLQVRMDKSSNTCVKIQNVYFELSGRTCEPKIFPERMTMLRKTFATGYRSEECIPDASPVRPFTLEPEVYKCDRKLLLGDFQFHPENNVNDENLPRCICDPGFQLVQDSSQTPECIPCKRGFFNPSAGNSCSFCPANSESSQDRTYCQCMPGFFPLTAGGSHSNHILSCEQLPSPVQKTTATVSGDVVYLFWQAPSNLAQTQLDSTVYIISVYNLTSNQLLQNFTSLFQSILLDSLKPLSTYRIEVRASYKGHQSPPSETVVKPQNPLKLNFSKENTKDGNVFLQWDKTLASSFVHFKHFSVQVLPRDQAKPRKNNRFLLIMDAEITSNNFMFNANNLKPIYGSFWDNDVEKYVEYSPVSTKYCVRVGAVERFSNPYQKYSDEDVEMANLFTHWSHNCESIEIGSFALARVVLWSCIFLLFLIILVLCVVVGCCFVKYKRRQFEALYPNPNLPDSKYQGTEYIVQEGCYPHSIAQYGDGCMPVGVSDTFWTTSPGHPESALYQYLPGTILPSMRHPLSMENDSYDFIHPHQYSMPNVGFKLNHPDPKNPDKLMRFGSEFESINKYLSDAEKSRNPSEKEGFESLNKPGKKAGKPPLPNRCPVDLSACELQPNFSSTNSASTTIERNCASPKSLKDNFDHVLQHRDQARDYPSNQNPVVPPRPPKTPPAIHRTSSGRNDDNPDSNSIYVINKDLRPKKF